MIAILCHRGRQRRNHGPNPFHLFVVVILAVLVFASVVVVAEEAAVVAAAWDATTTHSSNSLLDRQAVELVRHRSLQSASTIPDLTSLFTNGTDCPVDCPLCECALLPTTTNSSTTTTTTPSENNDAESCIYTKSIEACASGSLPKCYAGLLPFDFDIEGLCSVQCATTDSSNTQQSSSSSSQDGTNTATICRICDIFACCTNCPPGDVDQCFPPMSSDSNGYTPVGWKPLVCLGGEGSSSTSGGSSGRNGNDVVVVWMLGVVGVVAWLTWLV